MKRLTEKTAMENEYLTSNFLITMLGIDKDNQDKNTIIVNQAKIINTLNNKLGKLEDLEEQLGCDLEVVFKAIKNGIWFINTKNELEYIDEALSFNTKRDSGKFVFDNYGYYCQNIEKIKCNEIYLEDYKKTWWLKESKEE